MKKPKCSPSKYDVAVSILEWLVHMTAENPGTTLTGSSSAQQASWLQRTEAPEWVVIKTSSSIPWSLARAGLLEHRGTVPSMIIPRGRGASLQCLPQFRLSDLGRRWCLTMLTSKDNAKCMKLQVMLETAIVSAEAVHAVHLQLVELMQRNADVAAVLVQRMKAAGEGAVAWFGPWVALALVAAGHTSLQGVDLTKALEDA